MGDYVSPSDMISGARLTTNILSNRIVKDVSDTILLLDPNAAPLITLLSRLRKKVARGTTFYWFEDKQLQPYVSYDTGAASSGDTTFDVTTGEGSLLQAGNLLLNLRTGESMLVTSVSGDTITVVRGFGDSTPAAFNSGDRLYIINLLGKEYGNSPTAITSKKEEKSNYIHIEKHSVDMSGTMMAIDTYGGPDWPYERRKKAIEHQRAKEKHIWFGEKGYYDDPSDGKRYWSTKGVMNWLDSSMIIDNASGNYTMDQFFEDMETIGRYNTEVDVKNAFCAPHVLTTLSGFGFDNIRILPTTSTYGLNITRLVTPHITLNLIKMKLFQDIGDTSNPTWKKATELMVILDLEHLMYRFLRGRDTRIEMNVQDNDADGRKDMIISDFGLQFELPLMHGAITGVRNG